MADVQPDYVGYGENPPKVQWPNNARVCVSFVINYEEGGERNILNGDGESENYLTEIPGSDSLPNDRHYLVESYYEYGSRVGIYRLLSLFKRHQLKTTIYAVSKALEKNPNICKLLAADQHDIASHHYRWFNYRDYTNYATEYEHLLKVMSVHKKLCNNTTPKGMYIGSVTNNTKRTLYEYNDSVKNKEEKLLWHSDCYNDDIPHWDYAAYRVYAKKKEENIPLLNIPYSLTSNDFRFLLSNGYVTGDQFFSFCKDTFDQLFKEGGKMMSIGLHPRISGHPGRFAGLQKFVEYLMQDQFKDKVWIATRTEIADFWLKTYPPSKSMTATLSKL